MNWPIHIILYSSICIIFTQSPPDEFQYTQSSQQAFYFFNSVMIDDTAVESDDWVGAFNGDVCVGAYQWDISECGGVCAVPVMGYDSFMSEETEGYMQFGDIPSFKIYDASENDYYSAIPSENIDWINNSFPMIDNLNADINLSTSETGHLSPEKYYISNIYPNPFNPITIIEYSLPEYAAIDLSVYNMNGRHIQTLVQGFQAAGNHSINWNASKYPSGVYIIKMGNGYPSSYSDRRFRQTQNVVLIK